MVLGQLDAGFKPQERQTEVGGPARGKIGQKPRQPLPAKACVHGQLAEIEVIGPRRQNHAGDQGASVVQHPDFACPRRLCQIGFSQTGRR